MPFPSPRAVLRGRCGWCTCCGTPSTLCCPRRRWASTLSLQTAQRSPRRTTSTASALAFVIAAYNLLACSLRQPQPHMMTRLCDRVAMHQRADDAAMRPFGHAAALTHRLVVLLPVLRQVCARPWSPRSRKSPVPDACARVTPAFALPVWFRFAAESRCCQRHSGLCSSSR